MSTRITLTAGTCYYMAMDLSITYYTCKVVLLRIHVFHVPLQTTNQSSLWYDLQSTSPPLSHHLSTPPTPLLSSVASSCEWPGSTMLVICIPSRRPTSTLLGGFHSQLHWAPLHLQLLLPRELQPLPEVHPILLSGAHCVPSVSGQQHLQWV